MVAPPLFFGLYLYLPQLWNTAMHFKNFKKNLVRVSAAMGGHIIAFKAGEIKEVAEAFEEACLSSGLVPCSPAGDPGDLDADFDKKVEEEKQRAEDAAAAAEAEEAEEAAEKARMVREAAEKAEQEARLKRSKAAAKGQATKEANAKAKAAAAK